MSKPLPVGPYKQVNLGGQRTAPWYIMPFDKQGICTGPKTRQHLIDSAREKSYSDIFLFSHGWNNDWEAASERYESFLGGVMRTRSELGIPYPDDYKPVLVGIFWPSTALVLPWESGPDFAASPGGGVDAAVGEYQEEVVALAEDLPQADRERFYDLAQRSSLDDGEARELATLVKKVLDEYDGADEDLGGRVPPGEEASPEDLVRTWKAVPGPTAAPEQPGEFGFIEEDGEAAGPQAAFDLSFLDPRNAVRLTTVLQMKDRAARVGARGVSPLLADLLAASPNARVHLVGHSYGCIVMLSALCARADGEAPMVESVLLLQPAVSQWCFASNVAGKGYAGGYRPALARVRKPIFTTFSKNDLPLRKMFHLAARRSRDLGQPEIAGLPPAPSRFAALGGYGPAGLAEKEYRVVTLLTPPQSYDLQGDSAPEVVAINGDVGIGGHGDISNRGTWWALLTLIERTPPRA